jgi:hypothetical protein
MKTKFRETSDVAACGSQAGGRRAVGRYTSGLPQLAARLTLICVVWSLATGCGGMVTGHWYLGKAIPSKEIFAIDDVDFARDGSFTARVTIEGKTCSERGTYEFNGFKLTMRPQAGGQRRYNAVLKGRTLEVLDGDRKVILRKGEKAKKTAESEESEEE